MAERRAQNKWIPNSFDPKKFKSINDYVKNQQKRNSQGTRQAAKRKVEEEEDVEEYGPVIEKTAPASSKSLKTQTVRFELPFNCWCLGCGNHIGMGVRYNAEKVHVGYYHSSPLFSFRMKCHLCPEKIIINTDAKNGEYVLKAGLRKKIETFDPKDAELPQLQDEKEREKLESDVFYRLEHGLLDTKQAEKAAPAIEELQKYNDHYWKDPYTLSQAVRKKFRAEKKESKAANLESANLQDKLGLSLAILPKDDEDARIAKGIHFAPKAPSTSSSSSAVALFGKPVKKNEEPRARLLKLVKAAKSSSFTGKGF